MKRRKKMREMNEHDSSHQSFCMIHVVAICGFVYECTLTININDSQFYGCRCTRIHTHIIIYLYHLVHVCMYPCIYVCVYVCIYVSVCLICV